MPVSTRRVPGGHRDQSMISISASSVVSVPSSVPRGVSGKMLKGILKPTSLIARDVVFVAGNAQQE